MKKYILVALMTLTTAAFAQVREGKVANRAESREYLEKREDYKKYQAALKDGKMTDSIKKNFVKFLNDSLTKHEIGGIKVDGLESMISMSPDVASRIVELMTQAKNGTAEQKSKATLDLKIMSEGALKIDSASATAKEEVKALEQVSEMADYNQAAKDFKAALAEKLEQGAKVSDAIKEASKGKITLEKIKDCII